MTKLEKFKSLNKPFRRASVLDEFADEIFELQKEKYSFTQISEYLKFAHNVEVSKQRISTFIKSRKNDIHSKEDIKIVKKYKNIAVCSTKGGVGKTTLSAHILPACF